MKYESKNCYTDNGSGDYQIMYPGGTGIDECKTLCDALPFGVGENHCSCIIVRDNGQCYLKDGADASGCILSQCTDHTTDVYIRGMSKIIFTIPHNEILFYPWLQYFILLISDFW